MRRLNRKLAREGEMLKQARGKGALQDLGEYYAIDVNLNYLVAKDVDPEEWARELGVLRDWEKVAA